MIKLGKLTIKNIASIEQAEIDFAGNALGNIEGVFLISGDTGAGKTSIIDALCLSLYGKTPRLQSAKKVDGNNNAKPSCAVRRGSKEACAKLEFEGHDNQHYEVTWEAKEEKKEYKIKHTYKSSNSSNPVLLEKNTWDNYEKDILCLTFDEFCKTTMLAQGEFSKFLKSNANEKSSILEKITRTERYAAIGKNIHAIKRQKEADADNKKRAKDQAEGYCLKPEELARLNTQAEALEKISPVVSATVAILEAENAICAKAKELKEKEESFHQLLDAEKWYGDKEEAAQAEIDRLEGELKNEDPNKSVYDKVSAIESELGNMRKFNDKAKNLQPEIDDLEQKIDAKEGGKELRSSVTENTNVQESRDNALEEKKETGNISQLIKNNALANQNIEALKGEISKIKEGIPSEEQINQAQTLAEEKAKEYDRQSALVDGFIRLRAKLKEGDACPVCGKTIDHELSYEISSEQEKLHKIEEEKNAAAGEVKHLDETRRTAEEKISGLKGQIAEKQKTIDKNKVTIESFCEARQLEQTDEALKKYQDQQQTRADILKDILDLQQKKSYQQTAKDNAEAARVQINKWLEDTSWAEWQQDSDETLRQLKEAAEKYEGLKTKKGDAETHKLTYTTSKSGFERARTQIRELIPDWCADYQSSAVEPQNPNILQKLPSTITGIHELVKSAIAKESEREKLKLEADLQTIGEQFNTEEDTELLSKIQEALNVSSQLLQHGSLEQLWQTALVGQTDEEIDSDIEELKKLSRKLDEKKGSINKAIQSDTANRDIFEKAEKEYKDANEELEKWAKFWRIFGSEKGDKFRNIAQGYIVGNLLEKANEILRTIFSTEGYQLCNDPNDPLIFLVRRGQEAETRPVTNLSGGEGFLVSLALALALSRQGGNLINILFIDEGFGTLSENELNRAIRVLEDENRRVGIISHVEALKKKGFAEIKVDREAENYPSRIEIIPATK